MEFEVRRLDPPIGLKNAELLENLEKEAFNASGLGIYDIPAFALFGVIYLFYVDGELAGHAIVVRYYEKDSAFIYSFAIKKEFRGRGISSTFLKMLLEEIRKTLPVVYLTVRPDNEAALKIYKKAGFHVVELLKDFYGRGEDRYLMMLVFGQVDAL